MMNPILEVENLKTYFYTEAGIVKAVDDISFNICENETIGLVGESGSGKTVTCLSVLRIVPNPGRIVSGRIRFQGEDILAKSEEEMRGLRGKRIAMIFQDPTTSLNPVYTVESQLTEIIRLHNGVSREDARRHAYKLLEQVRLPDPASILKAYPHELSGGMKQRVCIARALSSQPELLFADEPTTNLDVTVQAQVLELLKDLRKQFKMSLAMITHDMGIIAEMTQRVVVLYAGNVFEIADTETIFQHPQHPYTEALLKAVPRLDVKRSLSVIPGNIPNLIDPPSGCRFHPRCKYAKEICEQKVPVLEETEKGHFAACHRWAEISIEV